MEVKRERYPYCVVLDFMVHYFKNEWQWDVDIKDTFDIYTKTIISLGSKSTLGSTTKKLEFGDDKNLGLVWTISTLIMVQPLNFILSLLPELKSLNLSNY